MSEIHVFNRRVFYKDILIAIAIITLPFLFYLYLLVPEVKVWETPFFRYDSKYYNDASVFVWTAMTKILTIAILTLWFVTCRHWWRIAIIIPIIIEIYKILDVFNDELKFMDNDEYILAIPISLPFIILLIFISTRLNSQSLIKKLDNKMDDEIEVLINELNESTYSDYKEKKMQYKQLKSQKNLLSKKEYLKKLVALKNGIILD